MRRLILDVFGIVRSPRKWREMMRIPLFQNAAFLITNSAASAGLNFVFWTVVARLYDAEAVGLSSALFSAVGILAFISTLGLGLSLIRFLPGAGENKAALVNSCFTIAGISALVVAGAFLLGLPLWSPALLFIQKNTIFTITFIGFTVFSALYGVFDSVVASFRKARFTALMTTIQGAVRIPLVIAMAGYFAVFGIFASWVLAGVATFFLGVLLFLPRLLQGYRPVPTLRRQVTGEMVKFSFANFLSTGLWQSTSWLLPIIVTNLLGGEANAYFFMAFGMAGLLGVIPLSIATSIFVEGSHHQQSLDKDIKRGLKFTAVLLLPALAVMLAIGDKLLLLFGREYSVQGTTVLYLAAIASLPTAVNATYISVARVKKQYRNFILVAAAVAASTLVLSYILIPTLGTTGVALAWLLGQSLVAIAVLPAFLKVLRPAPAGKIETQGIHPDIVDKESSRMPEIDPAANHSCPVCQGDSETWWPIPGWGEMRKCKGCGLAFANPMELPTSSKELYSQAYKGQIDVNDLAQFYYRQLRRKQLLKAGKHALTPPQLETLAWLRRNLPGGSRVMDIGCGTGMFLHALRNEGYKPVGIEPGNLPATALKEEGLEVWHGTLDDYPESWPKPDAVTCFYMLHHLPDPMGHLRLISRRFPAAPLLIGHYHSSVYLQGGMPDAHPPRNLTMWPPQALKEALKRAGYEATVQEVPATGREVPVPGVMRIFFSSRPIPTPLIRVFLAVRPYVLFPFALLKRHKGVRYYLWAVGMPQSVGPKETKRL